MKSQKQPLESSSMCLNVEELLLGYASRTELQTPAHGNKNSIVGPDFSAASIFPPRNMDGYLGVPITNRHEIKTKKFVFDV
ncbi:unnamed protein product [Prunus armeniaca]|uniref:Uncharacterized protein n=1 Tax=Prunus armeniaca TaxID=36596 RepID=A0A6J5TKI8_PRUAR|nr:unnamed protein product [Prunus armeniaca]